MFSGWCHTHTQQYKTSEDLVSLEKALLGLCQKVWTDCLVSPDKTMNQLIFTSDLECCLYH